MVAVRKHISVEQGDQRLFDEIRYVFLSDQRRRDGGQRQAG